MVPTVAQFPSEALSAWPTVALPPIVGSNVLEGGHAVWVRLYHWLQPMRTE